MNVLELFLDQGAKAVAAPVDSESELEALAQEFKDAPTATDAKNALKAFLALVNKK